jgi:uncharacterized protein YjeT (DUF2065 family)
VAWSDLGAAFALMLVFEGLLPFLFPQGFKQRLLQIREIPEQTLRVMGLISMLAGIALLYWVRSS